MHLTALVLLAAVIPASAQDIEKRIDALMAKMTLEEKLGQMSQKSLGQLTPQAREEIRKGMWGSFLNTGTPADRVEIQRIATKESRLGIPIIFGRDVIHGYRTVFPIPLGQSASWDPELVEQAARVAAREAAQSGEHWTFAPMLDIARDPRWGRVSESLGEDPYLAAALGAAMVRGFQGASLDAPGSIAACAKHFVGYGAAEGGRDYNTTWIPERLLRDVYLKPFQAAKEAGAAAFMSAFNDLNGVPTTGNPFTLRKILRDEWQFDGFVVSDWTSVTEMIAHGFAADDAEAALKAIQAGVDMEMVSTSFRDRGKALVDAKKLDPKLIDAAVRNILRVKFRMGLFDRQIPEKASVPELNDEGLAVAKRAAIESAVLLKNDNVLPLSRKTGKLAVIGPLADSPVDQMGTWTLDGRREDVRTPLAALEAALGKERIAYAQALTSSRDASHAGFAAALEAARSADAVVLFLGEEQILSGEAHSRAFLNLPGAQEALVDRIASAGKPVITVIMAGRPLTFESVAAKSGAILWAWHPGTMGGPAIAGLLFGDAVPSGKLSITFPRTVGQIPIYYSHTNTGRPPAPGKASIPTGTPLDPQGYTSNYLDVEFTPAYPFGFGLSYTTFEYSNLRLSAQEMPPNGKLTVSADIENTGKVAADEVVQLYVRDRVGSVTRPVRELKGFRRVRLNPGEKRTVAFELAGADLAFHNSEMKLVTEPGRFDVWVAPDSTRGVRGEFTVTQ